MDGVFASVIATLMAAAVIAQVGLNYQMLVRLVLHDKRIELLERKKDGRDNGNGTSIGTI